MSPRSHAPAEPDDAWLGPDDWPEVEEDGDWSTDRVGAVDPRRWLGDMDDDE